jgi:hypothetical protein
MWETIEMQLIWGGGDNCFVAGEKTVWGTTPVQIVALPFGVIKDPTQFVPVLPNYGELESSTGHIVILPIKALKGHRIEECATASQ